jgi:hypothetical protein
MPLGGSDTFAISGEHALFRGGYKDRDTYHLFSLGPDGVPKSVAKIELRDQNGNKLVVNRVVGRADTIYLISNGCLYRVDVRAAISGE